jgi:hypothetical protein
MYDALNRVLTKTAPNTGTITYTYDVTSGMSTGTWGEQNLDAKGNTIVKVYDPAGRSPEPGETREPDDDIHLSGQRRAAEGDVSGRGVRGVHRWLRC